MRIFAPVVGFFTRLCCALLGFGIPFISIPLALLASAFPAGEPLTPAWQTAVFVVGSACLLGSGFVLFAVGWCARFGKRRYRAVTFALLLIPLAAGLKLIASPADLLPRLGAAAVRLAEVAGRAYASAVTRQWPSAKGRVGAGRHALQHAEEPQVMHRVRGGA
eukprot:gene45395-56545_t